MDSCVVGSRRRQSLKLRQRLRHPVAELDGRTWDVGCLLTRSGHGVVKDVLCASSSDNQSSFAEQHLLHFWNVHTGELERVLEGAHQFSPIRETKGLTCRAKGRRPSHLLAPALQNPCFHFQGWKSASVSDGGKLQLGFWGTTRCTSGLSGIENSGACSTLDFKSSCHFLSSYVLTLVTTSPRSSKKTKSTSKAKRNSTQTTRHALPHSSQR